MNPSKTTHTIAPFAKNCEAANSAIRYPVTVGQKVSAPALIALRDISYVMECIRNGKFESSDLRPVIETIRGLPDTPLAKAMKANLPYFLGSVCERRRSNDTVKYAHFAIFDLDHVAQGVPTSSSEGCAELLLGTKTAIQPTGTSADPSDREVGAPGIESIKKQAIDKLSFIRYAFRSVRDGVKLIAQFKTPVTKEADYRVLWQYLALQVEHALGLPVDSTPDWSRACFMSYDPALLCNHRCQPVDVPQALEEAEMILRMREKSIEKREKMAPGLELRVKSKELRWGWSGVVVEWWGGGVVSTPRHHVTTSSRHHVTTSPPPLHPSTLPPSSPSCNPCNSWTNPPSHHVTTPPPGPDDYSRARAIVLQLAQKRIDYRDWVRIGFALYAAFGDRGKAIWDLFLANPYYEDTEVSLARAWHSFAKVHSTTINTLFYLGSKYGCE